MQVLRETCWWQGGTAGSGKGRNEHELPAVRGAAPQRSELPVSGRVQAVLDNRLGVQGPFCGVKSAREAAGRVIAPKGKPSHSAEG